jgi:hypothetical protein
MTFVIGVRTGHSIETETTTLIESPDQDDLSGNEFVPVLRATSTYSAFCTLRGVGGVRRLSRSSRHLESLRSELTDHRRAILYRRVCPARLHSAARNGSSSHLPLGHAHVRDAKVDDRSPNLECAESRDVLNDLGQSLDKPHLWKEAFPPPSAATQNPVFGQDNDTAGVGPSFSRSRRPSDS